MDEEAAERWNRRYADTTISAEKGSTSASDPPAPAWVLTRYSHLLPTQGRALDLACGRGANAFYLASHGLDTHAWDISSNAINHLQDQATDAGVTLSVQTRDVVQDPPDVGSFDVIVVSRFLERGLFAALERALTPGGVVFYQTFVVGNTNGPSNPDYLLGEGELLRVMPSLTVRAFEDAGQCGRPTMGFRNESCLVAQKPA